MWFLSFWILPVISACTWLGMLLAMLIVWLVEGSPRYPSMDNGQRIAYISDIGAQGLKPLFVAGCCVTTVFLDLSFAAERWLRHTGRLARNTGVAEKVLSALSILFAIAGTCGLILLSIFDTLRHPRLHDGFLLLFIAGYVLSAIFICAEYQRLGVHFRQHRVLRGSFWLKLAFILVEIAMAIAFVVCTFRTSKNAGAVLEWVVALIFTFYVLTFFVDLLPAVRTKHHASSAPQLELGHTNGGPRITNRDDESAANGQYGHGYMNSTPEPTTTSRYYVNGTPNVTKPPTAQNF
ncbi:MAG: hypothetical protein M1830_003452 [Pleopsidium flavum]|nr:MAG: hypothetical protein M1830_003452 [Pleopsidium flavum]